MIAIDRRLAVRVSVIATLCGALACSSGSTTRASSDGGTTAVAEGGAACKSLHAASQASSQPCCLDWGADACGAGLFCAAFDGRTQPTCYPDHSRLGAAECSADTQCLSNACDETHVCKGVPGGKCDPAIGCGTALDSETRFYCVAESGGTRACRPCSAGSREPACGDPLPDGGFTTPGVCVSSCTTDLQCQSTCPPVPGGVQCCDPKAGVCYGSRTTTCPRPPGG